MQEFCLNGAEYISRGQIRLQSMKCGHATKFELRRDNTSEKGIGFYENASFGWTLTRYQLIIESWTTPTAIDSSYSLGATLHIYSDCTGESGIVTGRFYESVDDLNELGFIDMNKMTVRSVRPAPGTMVVLIDQDGNRK